MTNFKSINVLTDDDWTPLYPFLSEMKTTEHLNPITDFNKIMETNICNVKTRVMDVRKWLEGEILREELIHNYNNFD